MSSAASEAGSTEFKYVEPNTSAESPRDILARVKAREGVSIATQLAEELVDDNRNKNAAVEQDDSYVDAIDVAPLQPHRSLASTPATTVMTQSLAIRTDAKLSINPIMTTTSKRPLATLQRYEVTLAEANAMIYVCMTLAAACLTLFGLGEDMAAIDLVLVLHMAFLFGVAVCTVLQWILGEWYASFLRSFRDGYHQER
ncbi:uncharacterized protein ALTATR162_LOCUS469 [Alternaria atra]|uniref:Uncharacterized protein n=1 Tax=Alternaria atra TaxID=119953 RepID=A0A8J2HRJ4_9PLEO|nr:uncharacterized protein ALTATR162_LOCUS469 [Alternaria atra]CAG5139343.1 unnamed protein product [Alternaria atra]